MTTLTLVNSRYYPFISTVFVFMFLFIVENFSHLLFIKTLGYIFIAYLSFLIIAGAFLLLLISKTKILSEIDFKNKYQFFVYDRKYTFKELKSNIFLVEEKFKEVNFNIFIGIILLNIAYFYFNNPIAYVSIFLFNLKEFIQLLLRKMILQGVKRL